MAPNPEEIARVCAALAVPTRVRIIQLLRDRVFCVGALARHLGVTQGAVSQHLRVLRDARLVVPERRGYFIHYRLDDETAAQWRSLISGFLGSAPPPVREDAVLIASRNHQGEEP